MTAASSPAGEAEVKAAKEHAAEWARESPDHSSTVRSLIILSAALARQEALLADAREGLSWYQEQVAGCRKLGHIGDPARHALNDDGGRRAAALLAKLGEG